MGSKSDYQARRFEKVKREALQTAARHEHRKRLILEDAQIFVSAFEAFIDSCINSASMHTKTDYLERNQAREKLISLLTGITK